MIDILTNEKSKHKECGETLDEVLSMDFTVSMIHSRANLWDLVDTVGYYVEHQQVA